MQIKQYNIRIIPLLQIPSPLSSMLLVILILLIKQADSQYGVLKSYIVNSPGHIYKVQINPGQSIGGYVTWRGNSNIDMVLYADGSDLGGQSYVAKFNSTVFENQTISYTASNSYYTNTYYLKVFVADFADVYYLLYNLFITKSSYYWYDNAFINLAGLQNKLALLISNPNDPSSLTLQYDIKSPLKTNIIVSNPNKNQLYFLQSNKTITLPGLSKWVIIVNQSQSQPVYSLTNYIFTLYYQCLEGYVWNSSNLVCEKIPTQNPSPGVPVGAIVGAVVGTAVLVFVIVFVVRYLRKKQAQKYQTKPEPDGMESDEKIHIDQNIGCTICLQQRCNKSLPCKHNFHAKCINQWFKKSKQCPICRSSPNSQSNIINYYSQPTIQGL